MPPGARCTRCTRSLTSFTVSDEDGRRVITMACKSCTRETGEPWVFRREEGGDLERWFPDVSAPR